MTEFLEPVDRALREGFFAFSAPGRGLYGRRRIEFTILGEPIPQGSTKAFARLTRDGRPFASVTHDNPRLREWRNRVATEVQRVLGADFALMQGPVAVSIVFELPRPKSLSKAVTAHLKKPDLDRLLRSVNDALTGVVWRDDSQVVDVHVRKRYAETHQPARAIVAVEG